MQFNVDLTNCDREPIHIPGKVQPHGVLLAFSKINRLVTHVSENTGSYFGLAAQDILDHPFQDFIKGASFDSSAAIVDGFTDIFLTGKEQESYLILKNNQGADFYLILHNSDRHILAEFEKVATPSIEMNNIMETMMTTILSAKSLSDTLSFAAKKVKEIIGYDRVMIYRFAADGNGEVVAEAVNKERESFFGLHYPASDIPKQARELYKKNLVRIIADVEAPDAIILANKETKQAPLDLTHSVLRAVSPIHIQYLKNMGVTASFSVSIISDGELWGLIACHNYLPKLIDYKKRNSCQLIGQLLSTSLIFRHGEENKDQRIIFNDFMLQLVKAASKETKIGAALIENKVNLLSINEASGAALFFENKLYTLGEVPTNEEIKGIAGWIGDFTDNQIFETNNLIKYYKEAINYKATASGLLYCNLSREMKEYIFWFKKEMPRAIKWAGNPHKPVEFNIDGEQSLSPRKSFEVWMQEESGVSHTWNSNELDAAAKLREALVDIVNERSNQIRKQNELLQQAYDELDTFSFTISHDLKTPLASIKNYAELLLEMEPQNVKEMNPMLHRIVNAADRMNLLIKEVLGYSRVGRQDIAYEKINMKGLLQEIKTELNIAYQEYAPSINIINCPDIVADRIMMYQVFSNVIGNGVKYSSLTNQPEVNITATVSETETVYAICDNGIGIDRMVGEQVFDLFKRMENAGQYNGTGVGLAIAKRIVEKHNSRIWYQSETGKGTTFYLSILNK